VFKFVKVMQRKTVAFFSGQGVYILQQFAR